MNDNWNKRYDSKDFVYGKEANKFLKEHLKLKPKARILLPGEGEGRNALYAAKNDYYVHAFDQSEIAAGKAMHMANSEGVRYEYQVCSVEEFEALESYYDVVGLIFLHIPSVQHSEFHRKIVKGLKPGGKIIAELFSKKQVGLNTGGPKNEDLLFSIEDLKEDFKDLDFTYIEEKQVELREGVFHQGKAWVIQFIAEKK